MQNNARIVGEPSYVMASVCGDCRQRHHVLRFNPGTGKRQSFCLRCQDFTRVVQAQVDEWAVIHCTESRNHKFGGEPDIEMGRKYRPRVYSPRVQDWHDFAHSEEFKYTDRIHSLKKVVIHNIWVSMPDFAIDNAVATMTKIKQCDEVKAESYLRLIIGECAEMLRPNAPYATGKDGAPGRDRKIELNHFVKSFGVAPLVFYPRKVPAKGDEKAKTLRPPMLRFVDAVESVITSFEVCI